LQIAVLQIAAVDRFKFARSTSYQSLARAPVRIGAQPISGSLDVDRADETGILFLLADLTPPNLDETEGRIA
jgi:hypothetical protein